MTQKIWRSPLGKGIDPLLPIIGRGAGKHRVQLLLQLEHMLLLRSQGSIQSANSVFHKRQFRFQFRSIAHQEFFVMAAPDGC